MIYNDEYIHNEDLYQKYVCEYCAKCYYFDPLAFEDCQYRRKKKKKKMCLLNKYNNDKQNDN